MGRTEDEGGGGGGAEGRPIGIYSQPDVYMLCSCYIPIFLLIFGFFNIFKTNFLSASFN